MNKVKLCVLIPLFLSTACATGVSDDKKSYCLVLPDVKQYSQQGMDKAAEEIEAGKSPMQTEFIKDYKVMRDETRVAQKALCEGRI